MSETDKMVVGMAMLIIYTVLALTIGLACRLNEMEERLCRMHYPECIIGVDEIGM